MKYVIFQMAGGILIPVLVPQHCTHSQVNLEGCTAISAGFFNTDTLKASGESESLKLKSDPERDGKLIHATMLGLGMYAFWG